MPGAFPPPGSTKTWAGRAVTNARHWYATTIGIGNCARCGQPITGQWHLGHIADRQAHPQLTWEPGNWQAEHPRCSTSAGATQGNQRRTSQESRRRGLKGARNRAARAAATAGMPLPAPTPARTATQPGGLAPSANPPTPRPHSGDTHTTARGAVFSGVATGRPAPPGISPQSPRSRRRQTGWLPDVPVPPVIESPVPDSAVGSYGPEFVAWCGDVLGEVPRPWQAYVAGRVLEHDADGQLVHRRVGISVPRQVGKSVLLRQLAAWRMHQADLFGEPQTVLHVAHALNTTEEVFVPALAWAKRRGLVVREANGQMRIQVGDSRWLPRSTQTGYGFTLSLALVDEAWAVAPRRVNSGYGPTLSERRSGQVIMFSSANELATPLFPRFRESVRDGWLVLEWSAPPGASAGDRSVWQAATPVELEPWREALMADELLADERTFRFERLNEWPVSAGLSWRELLGWDSRLALPPQVWEWAGVEAAYGFPPVVAYAARDGERVVVSVQQAGSTGEAAELVRGAGLPTLVGKSLLVDAVWDGVEVEPRTSTSARAVTDFRRLVDEGVLCHDGGRVLTEQVAAARVVYGPNGARLESDGRVDAIKAALWAAQAAWAHEPWFAF